MRIVKVGESYICPVCGKYTFEYAGDFDICPVCNWEDDLCQLENPDEEDCANHMSLNQAREAWAHGRRVDENGKTNDPPGGYSMEVVTLRPPYCFACAYSRNVWQVPRTGDALPGGKVMQT